MGLWTGSDDHWSQYVSRGRIRRRARKSRRKNGQRSPLSRNFDLVIKNARYGVSDMRKYVKIAFDSERFKSLSSPIYLLNNLGSLFQPRRVVVCMLAHCSQFITLLHDILLVLSLKVKTLGNGPL